MLTGPLFMPRVYDRVLTSRSETTLVALIGIVAFLFLTMGLLDHARARVLARAGARPVSGRPRHSLPLAGMARRRAWVPVRQGAGSSVSRSRC